MKYSCFSYKKKGSEIAKIVFKENFPITRTKDLRCTQEQCWPINCTYTVYFDDWSSSDMTVEYLSENRRKIFYNGNLMNKYYLFKNELTFDEFKNLNRRNNPDSVRKNFIRPMRRSLNSRSRPFAQ